MNIVLIGIQGCGKGTLVAGLEKHIDFSLVSMGQLFRDEIATGSELGKEIKKVIDSGELVGMDIVMSTVKKKLETDSSSIKIFDGFPRNLEQADALDKITNVDLVINLNLSKEVAIERLLNRLTCSKCGFITRKDAVTSNKCQECGGELVHRSDDTIESIEKRFAIFERETYPLLEKYKKQGVKVETIESIDKNVTLNTVLKVLNEYNYQK
ncbi:MAG: nucleoside monophosphate kinase [Clostridia bacterium]|nr:nucleoside monophosphate kinase [Clostridia bacterium]